MGRYITEYWPPGTTTADGDSYEAYIPHPLEDWNPELSRSAYYRLEAAEQDIENAVLQADLVPGYRWATDCLMLQSESLSSSAIEGVHSSLEGLIAPHDEQDIADRTALGNWEMLDAAVEMAHEYQPFTVEDIKELHFALMTRSDTPQMAGTFRHGPGWIGKKQHYALGPVSAQYVPPPAYMVNELMNDLVETINYSDLSPILKATLVHTQFETIHPFPDGNGRVGRALVLVSLGKSGLTSGAPMPISHALLENRQQYYKALLRYQRFTGDEDDPQRSRDLEAIALLMADCGHETAKQTRDAVAAIKVTMEQWNRKLASSRQKSAVWSVAEELVRTPVFTVEVMQEQTDLPLQTVYRCVRELKSRGVLTTNGSRRNTIYTADDILQIADTVLKIRSRHTRSSTSNKKGHSGQESSSNANPAQQSEQARSRPKRVQSKQQHNGIAVRCEYKGPRTEKQCVRSIDHIGQHRYQ